MAAIFLSLAAAAILLAAWLFPAGRAKRMLGILAAVCAVAAMGLFWQLLSISGGPDAGMELAQLYFPCAVYGLVILAGGAFWLAGWRPGKSGADCPILNHKRG